MFRRVLAVFLTSLMIATGLSTSLSAAGAGDRPIVREARLTQAIERAAKVTRLERGPSDVSANSQTSSSKKRIVLAAALVAVGAVGLFISMEHLSSHNN